MNTVDPHDVPRPDDCPLCGASPMEDQTGINWCGCTEHVDHLPTDTLQQRLRALAADLENPVAAERNTADVQRDAVAIMWEAAGHLEAPSVTVHGVTVTVYLSPEDGAPVVELDTDRSLGDDVPQIRVYVNDGAIFQGTDTCDQCQTAPTTAVAPEPVQDDDPRWYVMGPGESNADNRIDAASSAIGFTCGALVDDQAGGCVAYGHPDTLERIAATLNQTAPATDALVLVTGNPVDGLQFFGPYDDPEHAGEHGERITRCDGASTYTVATLSNTADLEV